MSSASNAHRVETARHAPATPEIPAHVAVIMDGNGRWAEERGLNRTAGHQAGTENIRRVMRTFAAHGVEYLTLFAFSTENWERPTEEVNALIGILQDMIRTEAQELNEEGVRLIHIGRLDRLPDDVQNAIAEAVEMTKDNTNFTVALAYDYGGRSEVTHAIRSIVADGVQPSEIDERLVSDYLYTAGIPDPDLIIRTAGEMRISNFLLWQAAYSEYYSTDVFWPDFDEAEADKAVAAYGRRQRKYGRVAGGAGE